MRVLLQSLIHFLKSLFSINQHSLVNTLAEVVEKKDSVTSGHAKRVKHYSLKIGAKMGLSRSILSRLGMAALLHDLGKIGVDDKILKKAGKLDEEEWPQMRKHPEFGYQIMLRAETVEDICNGMRYHHERWDGRGYPAGLMGREIPLFARIIAVADSYDAMISRRPYQDGMAPQTAFLEICRNEGTQFCPEVVQAFQKVFPDLNN